MEEPSNLHKKTNDDTLQININSPISFATTLTGLDEADRKLLQLLQDNFPLTKRPWHEISTHLGINEDEVLLRLKRLNEAGIIRKVGAIVDSSKIGLVATTLVAMRVPKSNIEAIAEVINDYANVSHNYEREHEFNIWFTVAAPNAQEIENTLTEIMQKTGTKPNSILNLPTIQRFKVNVRFQLT